jgi:hypothetical protein
VSLSDHLFNQHLISEALDVICSGGRYRLTTWELGQSDDETSHEVSPLSPWAQGNSMNSRASVA